LEEQFKGATDFRIKLVYLLRKSRIAAGEKFENSQRREGVSADTLTREGGT